MPCLSSAHCSRLGLSPIFGRDVARSRRTDCGHCGPDVFDRHSGYRRLLLAVFVDAERQPSVSVPLVGLARERHRALHPGRSADRSCGSSPVQKARPLARSVTVQTIERADAFPGTLTRPISSSSPGPSTRNNLKPRAMMTTPSSVQAIAWMNRCRPDRAHGGQERGHEQRHERRPSPQTSMEIAHRKADVLQRSQEAMPQGGSRPARATPAAGRTAPPTR